RISNAKPNLFLKWQNHCECWTMRKNIKKDIEYLKKLFIFAPAKGEMAEWSIAAVLKTVEGNTSGGSNPSFSATLNLNKLLIRLLRFFLYLYIAFGIKSCSLETAAKYSTIFPILYFPFNFGPRLSGL